MRIGELSCRKKVFMVLFLMQLVATLIYVIFEAGCNELKVNAYPSRFNNGIQAYLPSINNSMGQRHPNCSCTDLITAKSTVRIVSSCSDELSQFTPNQKVISFSFYTPDKLENIPFYMRGISVNLEAMRKLYPGYTLRLYTDLIPNATQCALICQNVDFHWCDIQRTPNYGNMIHANPMSWRFLPLGDFNVNIFHVRDLDSCVTEREVAAVQDWLNNTNKSIHAMRDHPWHRAQILGGMWGASNERLWNSLGYDAVEKLRQEVIKAGWGKRKKWVDQYVLRDTVYKLAGEIVAHDSYRCRSYTATMIRPFPVQRKGNSSTSDYVGNPWQGIANLPSCPEACRPIYGKNWKYC